MKDVKPPIKRQKQNKGANTAIETQENESVQE